MTLPMFQRALTRFQIIANAAIVYESNSVISCGLKGGGKRSATGMTIFSVISLLAWILQIFTAFVASENSTFMNNIYMIAF